MARRERASLVKEGNMWTKCFTEQLTIWLSLAVSILVGVAPHLLT